MTTTSTHTPGPWRLRDRWTTQIVPADPDGHIIAEVYADDILPDGGSERLTADVALITAAPDLLAALEQTRAMLDWTRLNHEFQSAIQPERKAILKALAEARAAIAKARG